MTVLTLPSDLEGWLNHIQRQHPIEIDMGLARVANVAAQLGLQLGAKRAYRAVLVGGTNGKGSTCAMLERIYIEAGYKVGKYTSPHLVDYNERVRLNLQNATDADLCATFACVQAACDACATALTFFEFGTLAAFLLFEQYQVDIAVVEVGLGGRLDATNLLDADVSAIVTVDLDHMQFLGETRDKIGFEKAGIYRSGKPALIGDLRPPQSVIDHANAIGATLERAGYEFGVNKANETNQQWQFWHMSQKETGTERCLRSSLPHPALRGPYQLNNAAVALAIVDHLMDELPVSANEIKRGLLQVELNGRFQVLPGRPSIVLDVAHNPHAAGVFSDALLDMGFYENTYAVFAMMRDKDVAGVIAKLKVRIDYWLLPTLPLERAMPPDQMKQQLLSAGVPVGNIKIFTNVAAAIAGATASVNTHTASAANASEGDVNAKSRGANDRIVCFGTFPLVADAIKVLGDRK